MSVASLIAGPLGMCDHLNPLQSLANFTLRNIILSVSVCTHNLSHSGERLCFPFLQAQPLLGALFKSVMHMNKIISCKLKFQCVFFLKYVVDIKCNLFFNFTFSDCMTAFSTVNMFQACRKVISVVNIVKLSIKNIFFSFSYKKQISFSECSRM